MRPVQFIALLLLATMLAPIHALAQEGTPTSAADAAEELRSLYFNQDFDGATQRADEWLARWPGDVALSAWAAMNYARTDRDDDAMALTDTLIDGWPDDPMSHVARAFVLRYQIDRPDDASRAAERALELDPKHRHAIWINAFVLHSQRKYQEVVSFLDEHESSAEPWAELLVMRGNAVMSQSFGRDADPGKLEEGLAIFAQAREMDPGNHNAHFFAGSRLVNSRRLDEGMPLLERALEISPYARGVLSTYWRGVQGLRDLTEDEKGALIARHADAVLDARGDDPNMLLTLATGYETAGRSDRKTEVEERLLEEHPRTGAAEWVLINRYRALSRSIYQKEVEDSAAAVAELREQLWTLLERTPHANPFVPQEVYRSLFNSYRQDTTVSEDVFTRIARGMAEHERINPSMQADVAIALADRGLSLDLAEQIASDGIVLVEEYMSERAESYGTIGEAAQALDWLKSLMYDALGWVVYKAGETDRALEELERARELKRDNPTTYYHLGRIAADQGNLDEAEAQYGRGRGYEIRGPKKNHEALEALFESRHGSLDGFEAFTAELDEKDRARRRQAIIDDRIAEPEPVTSFVLEKLDGTTFDSADLLGKVAVVNFWGVWCGPCIAEAPQLQEFHEKYRDDPDVVFLTIDNDPNPEDAREWMAENGIDYPVLLDDGYVSKVGVHAFPTTWFIDREGRIAFEHRGSSDVVFEEFVWRVEMLLEGR